MCRLDLLGPDTQVFQCQVLVPSPSPMSEDRVLDGDTILNPGGRRASTRCDRGWRKSLRTFQQLRRILYANPSLGSLGGERERYSQIQVGTCGSVAAVWHAGGDPQGAGRGHMNRRGALLQRPAGGGTLVPPCRVS